MGSDQSLDHLLVRLRRGDQMAATELYQRYFCRLIGLASKRLMGSMRRKVDPEDLVQSAFKSFFRRDAVDPFDVDSWDDLWSILMTITCRKCGFQTRHFLAGLRNIQKESPLSENSRVGFELLAREPTPAEAAMLSETVELLLAGLDDAGRQVVELSLQGFTIEEISVQVGLTERSVYRKLERIKQQIESSRDE